MEPAQEAKAPAQEGPWVKAVEAQVRAAVLAEAPAETAFVPVAARGFPTNRESRASKKNAPSVGPP
jgi:hypothetical protein